MNTGDMVRTQDGKLGKIVKIRELDDIIIVDVKCGKTIISTNIKTLKNASGEKYRWRK